MPVTWPELRFPPINLYNAPRQPGLEDRMAETTASSPYDPVTPVRDAFERWAEAPPREWDTSRLPNDPSETAWPNHYRVYHVQCAWEAWVASRAHLDRVEELSA